MIKLHHTRNLANELQGCLQCRRCGHELIYCKLTAVKLTSYDVMTISCYLTCQVAGFTTKNKLKKVQLLWTTSLFPSTCHLTCIKTIVCMHQNYRWIYIISFNVKWGDVEWVRNGTLNPNMYQVAGITTTKKRAITMDHIIVSILLSLDIYKTIKFMHQNYRWIYTISFNAKWVNVKWVGNGTLNPSPKVRPKVLKKIRELVYNNCKILLVGTRIMSMIRWRKKKVIQSLVVPILWFGLKASCEVGEDELFQIP